MAEMEGVEGMFGFKPCQAIHHYTRLHGEGQSRLEEALEDRGRVKVVGEAQMF
jgi:hypothetical protein